MSLFKSVEVVQHSKSSSEEHNSWCNQHDHQVLSIMGIFLWTNSSLAPKLGISLQSCMHLM